MTTEVKEVAQEVRVCCMNDCESTRTAYGLHTKMGEIWFCYQCISKTSKFVLTGTY